MHQFLKDKPSKVYFTITYTDEYNDEWTTAVSTIDYTTFCEFDDGPRRDAVGICLSTPTLGYTTSASTSAENHQPTRATLERLSEHVNNTLLALPTNAIPESYVWSAANSFDVQCNDGAITASADSDLRSDVIDCLEHPGDIHLVPREFIAYPWVESTDPNDNDWAPQSVYVDSLDFRLDLQITQKIDQTNPTSSNIHFDGTDTEAFGLGLFVKLPGPGVNEPLQVRYWYTPEATIGYKDPDTQDRAENDVSYSHVEGTSAVGRFTPDGELFLRQDLVVIQDLVGKRVWNPDDGDSEYEFSRTTSAALPFCSSRGICDFDSGICNCFSGYTGLRCDTQNAVTYSY